MTEKNWIYPVTQHARIQEACGIGNYAQIMTSPGYLFKKKWKMGEHPPTKTRRWMKTRNSFLCVSPLVVLVHSWIAIYCRWSCHVRSPIWSEIARVRWLFDLNTCRTDTKSKGENHGTMNHKIFVPSTQGRRTLPQHDNSWHTSTYPWDLMHHRLEDASGILEGFGPQHLRFSEWTLTIGSVLLGCPSLGTHQLKELQTPMTPQQLRFWANFDFNKWRSPSLPNAMVDSPPPIVLACRFCKHIAFDGDQSRLGGEGVAQGRPSRSMWERNHVLSLSGCKKLCGDPTLSSFQHEMPPFAEPTPRPAPHLWHKQVSKEFDFKCQSESSINYH